MQYGVPLDAPRTVVTDQPRQLFPLHPQSFLSSQTTRFPSHDMVLQSIAPPSVAGTVDALVMKRHGGESGQRGGLGMTDLLCYGKR